MHIDQIPLDRLSVSKANMRSGKKPPDVSDILPSIIKRGVISPLFVRPNCNTGHFEIVAGKRRYFASLEAARQGQDGVTLPCITLGEGDDAEALEVSMIENMLRQSPDQVTQWESYTRLVKEGRSVEDIAATFALTELQVKRILALGNLLPRIREAFRAEEIDAGTVKHLTLATKAQQNAWLALFEDADGYAPRGSQLKAWLFGGASIATSAALFDLAAFDGQIVKDLFGDEGYFADADQFWAAQSAEIERRKAAYLEDGWSAVEIVPAGVYFQTWEHEKTPKRKGGRVYIDVNGKGEVAFHEGYLTRKEARRQGEGGEAAKPSATVRPEITAAMTDYIDLHRHAAVRSALAANSGVALRVMVAHAICGSPLWGVRVQDQRSRNEAITESIETSVAEARFDERRRAVLAVLGFDPDEASVTLGYEPRIGVSGLFQRLLELPDAVVMEVLGVVMAETLASGTGLIEIIGLHLGVDMADYWVADDAFYGLIRDREVLTAILSEVGGASVAEAHAAEKGKTIKGVIGDYLTGGNGRERRENWVPRWMAFPPSAYTQRGGVATVAAANRAAWLAEPEAPLDPNPAAAGAADAVEDGDGETADARDEAEDQRLAA
ncbi:chromosome partitioning protein ParB [Sphingopyxis sp. H050]|uniref:ParB/RepB/Spo0J family partition protein n=1 Tax=Sphingopyxis sp. H050 TaxID=1759072 RepID=UPI000736271B|nr:ParB/RepB/Spo0J family partition protein [Sphingopyxis sp. H050]KTE20546.1 chromosome partitioning protein ParB [Sphingopyxis sp. H050]